MRWSREVPREGTWRTRVVRALMPKRFKTKAEDGTPIITWIWLEHYEIEELYQYGRWCWRGEKLK